ncbi:recombinase family protein [Pelagibius sp.]|uniref:recombinase family protein n=1 Tax=Pelagibius sp. TaxID=1931238 RepID=UPI003BB1E0AF
MHSVVYARYSSDNQRDASIEDQIRLCRAFIASKGWTDREVYSDRALSGTSTLRPAYQQLLTDAQAGAFEVVVSEALDRLSRDQADVASLFKQLQFLGIKLVTLAEGEISELHVGLKGTMNALFLKDLAQKTRRGLEGRVRQGKSGGSLCYGYKIVRAVNADGSPLRGDRTIEPNEAAIIRRIFQAFAAGRSPASIDKELNAEQIPGPRSKAWRDTAIRGHATRGTGILNNELYIGRLIWNRQRYLKDPATGKRQARLNPPETWIVEDVPELRIVDDDLWQQAKDRQQVIAAQPAVQKIKASGFWTRRRARHLLTGLVFCGSCGGRFAAVGRDYLACSAARKLGQCDNKRGIKRPDMEAIILGSLRARLMQPDLVKEFIAAYHAEVNQARHGIEQARRGKERELAKVSQQLDGLVAAIAEGLRASSLQQKLNDLEARKEMLIGEIAEVPPSAPRLHPKLAEVYARKVEDLHAALAQPEEREAALSCLRNLIERVVVTSKEDGLEIELVGAIARMVEVALASGNRKAVLDERTACSVKVVAGARNRLKLTPLLGGLADWVAKRSAMRWYVLP